MAAVSSPPPTLTVLADDSRQLVFSFLRVWTQLPPLRDALLAAATRAAADDASASVSSQQRLLTLPLWSLPPADWYELLPQLAQYMQTGQPSQLPAGTLTQQMDDGDIGIIQRLLVEWCRASDLVMHSQQEHDYAHNSQMAQQQHRDAVLSSATSSSVHDALDTQWRSSTVAGDRVRFAVTHPLPLCLAFHCSRVSDSAAELQLKDASPFWRSNCQDSFAFEANELLDVAPYMAHDTNAPQSPTTYQLRALLIWDKTQQLYYPIVRDAHTAGWWLQRSSSQVATLVTDQQVQQLGVGKPGATSAADMLWYVRSDCTNNQSG